MRRVLLQGTGLVVSRLSFGTASLHHLPTRRQRQTLLASAVDHGFTHFDTSPYYGFGIAERELGALLKGNRTGLTVTTKVGLYPPRGSRPRTFSVWTRKLAGALAPSLSRPAIDWSVSAAANSLDASLLNLGLEQIDLLLLHEPSPDVPSDAFLEWLRKEEARGRIRAWGLAGEGTSMAPWLSTSHPLGMVLQVRDSLQGREADVVRSHGRELQLTYGYLSAPSDATPAATVLEAALRRNARGSVLVSTRRVARIVELASAAEKDDANAA